MLAIETKTNTLTYQEASQNIGWVAAMQEEMHSIAKNGTWDLVNLLPAMKPISAKWVFKNKVGLPRGLQKGTPSCEWI